MTHTTTARDIRWLGDCIRAMLEFPDDAPDSARARTVTSTLSLAMRLVLDAALARGEKRTALYRTALAMYQEVDR